MRTRATTVGRALVAGTLLALLGVPVPSASAVRPPPGDEDGGPIEPESPGPTTPAPRLDGLTVRTDSVVAIATIVYNGPRETAVVEWGDGTTTRSCPPGDPGPVPAGCFVPAWGATETPGVITLRHEYAAPPDGSVFTVTARFAGETLTHTVPITPRYRVTQSPVRFRPVSLGCDTDVELFDEWRVTRLGAGLPNRTWDFDWVGDIEHQLPDSAIAIEAGFRDHRLVTYKVVERDPMFDDVEQERSFDLTPQLGNRSVHLFYSDFFCSAEIWVDVTVEVVAPITVGDHRSGGGGGVLYP